MRLVLDHMTVTLYHGHKHQMICTKFTSVRPPQEITQRTSPGETTHLILAKNDMHNIPRMSAGIY